MNAEKQNAATRESTGPNTGSPSSGAHPVPTDLEHHRAPSGDLLPIRFETDAGLIAEVLTCRHGAHHAWVLSERQFAHDHPLISYVYTYEDRGSLLQRIGELIGLGEAAVTGEFFWWKPDYFNKLWFEHMTGGSRPDLIPVSALYEAGRAMGGRTDRDGERPGWHTIPAEKYRASLKRHIDAYFEGKVADADSGLHPLAHALSNCAILLAKELLEEDGHGR